MRDLREDADLHHDAPASQYRLPRYAAGGSRLTQSDVDVCYHDIDDSDYHPAEGDDNDMMHAESEGECRSTTSASGSSAQAYTEELSVFDEQAIKDLRAAISDVFLPTWLDRPPANLGEASHGKLKADTYFVLFTVILPLHLVEFWTAAPRQARMLRNFCDLVTCTNIACAYSASDVGSRKFEEHYQSYSKSSVALFPSCRTVPNHHYAYHIPEQQLYWGPLMRLSEFAFERQNGLLQKLNTNSHLGQRI